MLKFTSILSNYGWGVLIKLSLIISTPDIYWNNKVWYDYKLHKLSTREKYDSYSCDLSTCLNLLIQHYRYIIYIYIHKFSCFFENHIQKYSWGKMMSLILPFSDKAVSFIKIKINVWITKLNFAPPEFSKYCWILWHKF